MASCLSEGKHVGLDKCYQLKGGGVMICIVTKISVVGKPLCYMESTLVICN